MWGFNTNKGGTADCRAKKMASEHMTTNLERTIKVDSHHNIIYKNTFRWIGNRHDHGIQCSFSESFFSVFILGNYLFLHNPLWASNITLQIPQEQSQWTASLGESSNSVRWINRTESRFSESFLPGFNWRYFLFHYSPLWASKYHFSNSTETVLA